MSKIQTRRAVSLSRALYSVLKERADAAQKPVARYLHDIVARELGDDAPPIFVPVRTVPDTLPKSAPITRMRKSGSVRLFKPDEVELKLAALDAGKKPKVKRGHCSWCEDPGSDYRPLVDGMHPKCAAERNRVESRTKARAELAGMP